LNTGFFLSFFFLFWIVDQGEALFKRDREGNERVACVVFVNPAFDFS
jgi:hypothetical protein